MYEKGLFGVASAEGLVNTLRLLNTINFGLRGCEEHRQMTWGDVKVAQETDGSDYLEYTERQTKTKSETEPRNIRTVKPKAFAAPNGLPERNPVFVYKLYAQKKARSDAKVRRPILSWHKPYSKLCSFLQQQILV